MLEISDRKGEEWLLPPKQKVQPYIKTKKSPSNKLSQARFWHHVNEIEQAERSGGLPVTQDIDGIELEVLSG